MKNIKFYLVIMLSIMVLSTFFLPITTGAATKMPDGSVIANVSIAGMSESEGKQMLEDEIATWQAGEDINLSSDFEQYAIPRSAFEFDIDTTFNEFNERTKRTFTSLFMRQKNVHIPLRVHINYDLEVIQTLSDLDYFDLEETFSTLTSIASQLEEMDASITYIEGKEPPLESIAEAEMQIPQLSQAVLTYAIEELNDYIIGPNDTFSFLQVVNFPDALTTSTKEISFLATALYQLFLQTNFDIVERHAGVMVPSYSKAGLDAVVNDQEKKDLVVMNPGKISYKIEVSKTNDQLQFALKSMPLDTTYKYETKHVKEIKQRTVYRYSKKLKAGESKLVQQGQSGFTVEVLRSSYSSNDSFLDSEVISKDVYLPIPKIVLVSPSEEVPEDMVDSQVDDENIEEEIGELEEHINGLDEELNGDEKLENMTANTNKPINIIPIDQLEEIKKEQAELHKRIATIEEKFKIYELTLEEDMEEQQKQLAKRFKELKEQYEKILESLLEDDDQVDVGRSLS